MPLSSDLISEFVKVTKDEVEVKQETTTYGTIVSGSDKTYVKLDGSDLLTPVASTASVENGDRVTVMIKDHSATVTGNLTDKSAGTKSVKEIGDKITDAEGDISGLKTFESTTSKWISDTDEALQTTYITNTKLSDELGNYVESSTFNSKVEGALENSATITNLTEKLDIDPETGEAFKTITNKVNEVKQTADGLTAKVSSLEEAQEGNNTRMTAMETNIASNSEAIELRATKTEAQNYADGALKDAKTYVTSQGYLTVTSKEITSKVSKSDFNGANIVSEINQTSDEVKITAGHIELNGVATFVNTNYVEPVKTTADSALSTANGAMQKSDYCTENTTTIDGGKITAGSISADKINVTDLFAQDITATGNIQFQNGKRYSLTASDDGNAEFKAWNNMQIKSGLNALISSETGYIELFSMGDIIMKPSVNGENGILYYDGSNEYPFLNTKNTADYVVAQGTSGIWTYRKWSSGVAECFGLYPIGSGLACTTAFGSSTGWYRTPQFSVGSYPFTFKTVPNVIYGYRSGAQGVGAFVWVSNAESASKPGILNLCRPGSVETIWGYVVIYAVGEYDIT